MKIFILFILVFGSNSGFSKNEDLKELKKCLLDGRGNIELAPKCYDLSLKWAASDSIEGRALHLQAMAQYFYPLDGGTLLGLTQKLIHYYDVFILHSLNKDFFSIISDSTLLELVAAEQSLNFYSSVIMANPHSMANFILAVEEALQRNLLDEESKMMVYSVFLLHSDWNSANNFLTKWPIKDVPIVPEVLNPDSVSDVDLGYYEVAKDLKSMTWKEFNPNGSHIVMKASCHFAYDLFGYFKSLKGFSSVMEQHGLVLGDTDFLGYEELVKDFPEYRIHPVHRAGYWQSQGYELAMSPSMNFVKDGVVKYSVKGFTDFVAEDFCRGLKSIELPLPAGCKDLH